MMKKRAGFSFLELVFVIVILGLISKFGAEYLAQAYRGFIYQSISSKLQDQSEIAVEVVASKLQYRLKDSVIIRKNSSQTEFKGLEGAQESTSQGYNILEWVGYDIEGFQSIAGKKFAWSGLIDKKYAHSIPIPTDIYSPDTNTTLVNQIIKTLSKNGSDINDSAIFIMDSDSDVRYDYGWQFECANADCSDTTGLSITDQMHAIHPIHSDSNVSKFVSANGQNFAQLNVDLDDVRYKLVWSAYALVYEPGDDYDGNLTLYYDYQPWHGENYLSGKKTVIMQHVSSFRKRQSFNVIKLQICVKNNLIKNSSQDQERYSICKEKTVY